MMSEKKSDTSQKIRFAFGQNWANFIEKHFTPERIKISQKQILSFLKYPDLVGKSFLDIGCGSGLHSLAAFKAGAKEVFSFDYDPISVKTTQFIRAEQGNPASWTVQQASVLDADFMKSLPKFDVVYSWGVLHHTGEMWNAIKNATIPLDDNGLLFLALYTHDVQINPSAEFWLDIKKKYNRKKFFGKKYLEFWYFLKFILIPDITNGNNTLKRFKDYKEKRGMDLWTDIKDWLGGWPMEFIKIMDMQKFADIELGLTLLNMTSLEANAEFLFKKKEGINKTWDEINKKTVTKALFAPFQHETGNCWSISFSNYNSLSDDDDNPRRSPIILFEDKYRLPLPHSPHCLIANLGNGRYSHWHDKIFFSSSDNSNPNVNGKTYSVKILPN